MAVMQLTWPIFSPVCIQTEAMLAGHGPGLVLQSSSGSGNAKEAALRDEGTQSCLKVWPLHRRANHQRPEAFELRFGIIDERQAHLPSIRQQQILVVARALLPTLHDFFER